MVTLAVHSCIISEFITLASFHAFHACSVTCHHQANISAHSSSRHSAIYWSPGSKRSIAIASLCSECGHMDMLSTELHMPDSTYVPLTVNWKPTCSWTTSVFCRWWQTVFTARCTKALF